MPRSQRVNMGLSIRMSVERFVNSAVEAAITNAMQLVRDTGRTTICKNQ